MSYAQQYDDRPGEWFWENPPDAREGDECFNKEVSKWEDCLAFRGIVSCAHKKRRRLIQAGEGFRILGLDEGIGGGAKFTSDGIEWKTMWNEHKRTPAELDKKHDNILAIRVPIVVESNTGRSKPSSLSPEKLQQMKDAGFEMSGKSYDSVNDLVDDLPGGWQTKAGYYKLLYEELKNTTPDPHIQAVIDAARDVVKVSHYEVLTVKHVSKKISNLETALADLNKESTKERG